MTRTEAIAIRSAQLRGEPVKAIDLQEAIWTLQGKTRGRMRLPRLSQEDGEKADGILLLNIGRALRGVAA